jgi:general secretion pathway protein G
MKRLTNKTKNRGFTLVELLVVVTILGILVTVVGLNVLRHPDRARQAAAKTQIAIFKQALGEFYIDTGAFPSNEEGLRSLVEKPLDSDLSARWAGPYIEKVPRDPWGRDYLYRLPGTSNTDFDVVCYGKDGVDGGEGVSKDITNHNLDEI